MRIAFPPSLMGIFGRPHQPAAAPRQPVEKTRLLLVTMVADDSVSMRGKKAQAVINGQNEQIRIYQNNPGKSLISTRYINGSRLSDYVPPSEAILMNAVNYPTDEGSPIHKGFLSTLKDVEAAADQYAQMNQGAYDVYTMTILMTDGEDTDLSVTAGEVRAVVERMILSGRHMILGQGISDGGSQLYEAFKAMGLPNPCIQILSGNTQHTAQQIVQEMTRSASLSTVLLSADPDEVAHTMSLGFDAASGAQPMTRPLNGAMVADMMIPNLAHNGPRGITPAQPLSWEPDTKSFRWRTDRWVKTKGWNITQDPSTGLYQVPLPSDNSWLILGKAGDAWDQPNAKVMQSIVDEFQASKMTGEIIYVPLIGNYDYLSRAHILITPYGNQEYVAHALRGDVTLFNALDENHHQYLQGNLHPNTTNDYARNWVHSGQTVQLVPEDKKKNVPPIRFQMI